MTKKIFILIIIVASLTGCTKKENKPTKEVEVEKETSDYVDPYIDDNPITLSLYQNNNNTRTKLSIYESPLTIYKDIISLEVYYTTEESFTGNQKELWTKFKNNYQNIEKYKIGYNIEFETTKEKISRNILSPKDTESIFNYIQIYLYDDINQESSYYSHITQEEITDKTLLTSIKLTASTYINDIISPIIITAFTYDTDDFDKYNNYKGKSSYKVTINRKE